MVLVALQKQMRGFFAALRMTAFNLVVANLAGKADADAGALEFGF